jgi:hypothetical protein
LWTLKRPLFLRASLHRDVICFICL